VRVKIGDFFVLNNNQKFCVRHASEAMCRQKKTAPRARELGTFFSL
jgi:hypothetical protein